MNILIAATAAMTLGLPAGDFDQTHARFTEVLKARVKNGVVDYAGLRKDRAGLDAYLKELERVDGKEFARWGKKQRIAFWINAYNAYTLKLIIDNKPVESIKDIRLATFTI